LTKRVSANAIPTKYLLGVTIHPVEQPFLRIPNWAFAQLVART
jgi:hypothetical protein